jgi:hypothetical protein
MKVAPGETEAGGEEEEPDPLVAGPPDVPEQIERQVPEPVAVERRQLPDADVERRPAGERIPDQGRAEDALGEMVEQDPDEGDALEGINPSQPPVPGRSRGQIGIRHHSDDIT